MLQRPEKDRGYEVYRVQLSPRSALHRQLSVMQALPTCVCARPAQDSFIAFATLRTDDCRDADQ